MSPEELRSDVVSFLATHPFANDGSSLENYIPIPLDWDVYLTGMAVPCPDPPHGLCRLDPRGPAPRPEL